MWMVIVLGSRIGRAAVAIGGGALVLATVTGCDIRNNQQGPASFTVNEQGFELAVCADLTAVEITLDTSRPAIGAVEFTEWWKATGSGIPLSSGDVVATDGVGFLFTDVDVAREPDLTGVEAVGLTIVADDPSDNVIAVFPLAGDRPWERGWVHPDGRVTSTPCESSKGGLQRR